MREASELMATFGHFVVLRASHTSLSGAMCDNSKRCQQDGNLLMLETVATHVDNMRQQCVTPCEEMVLTFDLFAIGTRAVDCHLAGDNNAII